jgi:hypothetical protein
MPKKREWWREWCFPELSGHENAIISIARKCGYASFFPSMPNATAQAKNTLSGAVAFLGLDKPETFFDETLQSEIKAVVDEISAAKRTR